MRESSYLTIILRWEEKKWLTDLKIAAEGSEPAVLWSRWTDLLMILDLDNKQQTICYQGTTTLTTQTITKLFWKIILNFLKQIWKYLYKILLNSILKIQHGIVFSTVKIEIYFQNTIASLQLFTYNELNADKKSSRTCDLRISVASQLNGHGTIAWEQSNSTCRWKNRHNKAQRELFHLS